VGVLFVICRPGGAEDLPFRSVASHLIRQSDEARQILQVDVLRPPTFARLGQVLHKARAQGRPYHVVHFDGDGTFEGLGQANSSGRPPVMVSHGSEEPPASGYRLLFEDPSIDSNVEYVAGPILGKLLASASVPFLVLNACRSAHAELAVTPDQTTAQARAIHMAPDPTGRNPHARVRAFAAVAQEAMQAGVPGLVTMRYSVPVATSARFVGELYSALLAGQQLGEAVARGRQHLIDNPTREVGLRPIELQDWIVPTVYEAAPLQVVARSAAIEQLAIVLDQDQAGQERAQLEQGYASAGFPVAPDVGFYGRDETLLALDRAFDTHRIVLLHAWAGAGKTTTAVEFARWFRHTGGLALPTGEGTGPVLFTSFQHHRSLVRVLDQIGETFDAALQAMNIQWLALNDRQRREVALQVLSQVPVLWIWDNVEAITGFPTGTKSPWTSAEQRDLVDFLRDLGANRRVKVLLTSRRDEDAWLGDLPYRIGLPPMPMAERMALARAVANKRGRRLTHLDDWRPLLAFTEGNPLTVILLVEQALRAGLRTRDQVEEFVTQLRTGEAAIADEQAEARSASLGASLRYGLEQVFSNSERAQVALVYLFQGFVDVDVLRLMGDPEVVETPVPEVRGLERATWIGLLDRGAEIGVFTSFGGGYYAVHPALASSFRRLFTTAHGSSDSASARLATHAFVTVISSLGTFYLRQYEQGRREVIYVLTAEEANLLHARRMARAYGWWDHVLGAMQGLRVLYEHQGRTAEWARLVDELVPDLVDPVTDGPRPGREDYWALLTDYRVYLALQAQDSSSALHLQRARVGFAREQAAPALTLPSQTLDDDDRSRIRSLAAALQTLGGLLLQQADPACVAPLEEAGELCQHIGARQEKAVVAYNLGNAYLTIPALQDLDQAETWYRRSLDLRDAHDFFGLAKCNQQLGNVALARLRDGRAVAAPDFTLLEHLRAAQAAYQRALDLTPSEMTADLAILHHQLGLALAEGGMFEEALGHYQASIRYEETTGNRYGAGQTRDNVALLLYRAGRFDQALIWAQAALRDFESSGERASTNIERTQRLIVDIEAKHTDEMRSG
jgi:tetratricopeptide (TPR) repeat protein